MKDFKQDDPTNWKFGMFYINNNDYRLFVRKINPALGWTLNFAHPVSYVILVLILAIPFLFVIFQ